MTRASTESSSRATYTRSAQLLGVLATGVALATALLSATAINDLVRHSVSRGVLLLIAVVAVRWCASSALQEWTDSVAARLRGHWRATLVSHFSLPRREGERGRGDLALAIEHAAEAPSLTRLGASAASSLLGVFIVFWAAGWLPFTITLALLALAAPLYRRSGQRSETMAFEYQQRRALLEARQLEILQHAPELRALGAVTYGANEIAAISDSEHVLALRAIRVALGSSLVTEFLSGVSIGLVAMVVGFALLGGHVSLVRALVAVLVTSELFAQVRRYGVEFHRRDDADRALDTLDALIPPDPTLASDELLIADSLVTEASDVPLTFRVHPGDRIVITGPSGAGKTTLLHTLLGWRQLVEGTARRRGVPVGYVSVESSLISGTLRENLTLGVDLSDERVSAQLNALGLTGERFFDLDAQLLSDGRGMSSGERVRLILARALLADASLLVLDDVAGVLDHDARDSVREALAHLSDVAVVEATVDTPLLEGATQNIEIHS